MKERVNNNAEILNDKERESVNHTLMQKNPIHLVEEIIVDLPPLPPVGWKSIEHSQRGQRDVYDLICHGRVTTPLVVEGGNIVILIVMGIHIFPVGSNFLSL